MCAGKCRNNGTKVRELPVDLKHMVTAEDWIGSTRNLSSNPLNLTKSVVFAPPVSPPLSNPQTANWPVALLDARVQPPVAVWPTFPPAFRLNSLLTWACSLLPLIYWSNFVKKEDCNYFILFWTWQKFQNHVLQSPSMRLFLGTAWFGVLARGQVHATYATYTRTLF